MNRKWKVEYSGFVYVEAETPDEAKFLAEEGVEIVYSEEEYHDPQEVKEFLVEL